MLLLVPAKYATYILSGPPTWMRFSCVAVAICHDASMHIRGRIVTDRNATHEKRIRVGWGLRRGNGLRRRSAVTEVFTKPFRQRGSNSRSKDFRPDALPIAPAEPLQHYTGYILTYSQARPHGCVFHALRLRSVTMRPCIYVDAS